MRRRTLLLLACALPLLGACGVLDHGFLNAQGPVAAHERTLFRTVFGILFFVWVPVIILVPAFAWHYRLSNTKDAYRPKWDFSWPLEGFIWLPPFGIVVLLAWFLWPATHRDDPYRRLSGAQAPLRVQAIGLDWKWVFVYPDGHVASVNELAVPAGRPVEVELTSGTVMRSLLLPQLAGQIYAMAGMRTRLTFAADRPGRTRGENTQFSGEGFAREKFDVVAMAPDAFRAWTKRAATAPPLDAAAWRTLSQRAVAAPALFSHVPDGFFDRVVAADGGGAHVHPTKAN